MSTTLRIKSSRTILATPKPSSLCGINEESKRSRENTKTIISDGLGESESSTQILLSWETWTRTRNDGTRIHCFAN